MTPNIHLTVQAPIFDTDFRLVGTATCLARVLERTDHQDHKLQQYGEFWVMGKDGQMMRFNVAERGKAWEYAFEGDAPC